jgi:hypothetical protein
MKKIYLLILTIFFVPKLASAHAFGQLYNLPVPFWLYLYGGAAAVIVSFFVIGYFFNKTAETISYTSNPFGNLNSKFITVLQVISIILFLLTIATGLFGRNSSLSNFNMTFFWIIFMLGLAYMTALIGNVYHFINPWKILFSRIGDEVISYPKWLGYYPALIFYFGLIWLELVGGVDPRGLSIVLIIYTLINISGVMTFGAVNWFRYAELFSVFFRLIGKVSPVEYRSGRLHLRPPFVGLLKESAEHFSLLLFVLFMLSSTAFDGFRETLPWVRLYWWYLEPSMSSLFGGNAYHVFDTLGLLLSPFVFLLIYICLIWLAKLVTKSSLTLKELILRFAFTLIPIALVYNVAHYYTLVFSEGTNIIRLISDPFGFGWNLFGTAKMFYRIILDANFVWHSQVSFILLGHIASVYLAHIVSLQLFPSQKKAILSQIPMLVLMVAYTMIGLWILSQPLTGGTL